MAETGRLTNQDIVDWVLACLQEADEGKQTHALYSEKAWRAYFNDVDFTHKRDWQTKVAVPMWAMGVDQAAGAIKQAMKEAKRLFTIELLNPYDPFANAQAAFISDLLHELLRQSEANSVLGDGVKVALITNIHAHKVLIREQSVERFAPELIDQPTGDYQDGVPTMERVLINHPVVESRMMVDLPVINPKHLYLDPTGRNLYHLQRALRDRATLETPEAQARYRAQALEAIRSEGADQPDMIEDEEERTELQIPGTRNPYRKQVEILEYWGPIYDKQGRQVYRNRWVVIFNRKHLALMEPYPFWHGGDPFVINNLIRVPFSPFGKLLYQHVGSIGTAVTETICMLLDAAKFATLGGFAVDHSLLEDVEELADGIFPGMNLTVNGSTPVQQLQFRGPDSVTQGLLAELQQFHQNYMGVTEFLMGAPSVRGRATATEVQSKTAQSAAFFDSLSGDLEDYGFEPMIEKTYFNVMQFFDDWSQPMLRAIAEKHGLRPEDLGNDPVQRYDLLNGSFRFHVAGLSAVLRRSETLEKLLRLMEVLGNRPEFLMKIDSNKLFEKIMEAFQFDDIIAQTNQLPPVITPSAIAPPGFKAVPGNEQFAAPVETPPPLGQVKR